MSARRRPRDWASGAITRLVMTQRPPRHRNIAVALLGASVVAIGLLDAATGRDLSFAIFYLLPVTAVTVLFSTGAGYVLAVASAVVWVLADRLLSTDGDVFASVWNGVLRALTISAVVFLLGALRAALVEAAASRQRTEDFLATAAHQLRTPVAGLMASAEALAVETDVDRRNRLTRNLVDSTDRVGRLLTSLLQLSRIDRASEEGGELGRVDLADLCRAETDSAAIRYPAMRFDFDGPTELVAGVERAAIAEAIGNLLENAARHATTQVRVELRAAGDGAVIDVVDDGPGLSAGTEEAVFGRFVVADGLGGTGLGLPIARELVATQRGELTYVDGRFRIVLDATRPR